MEEHKKSGEHHTEHHPEHHKSETFVESVMPKKKNDWKTLSAILGIIVVLLLGYVIYINMSPATNKTVTISGDDAGKKLVDFLNGRTGGGVAYINSSDMGNIYEVTVSYQSQDIPVYITKDGQYFVQGAIPLTGAAADNTQTPACKADSDCPTGQTCQSGQCVVPPKPLVKSDKPVAELFVMSYCPYGTQAEKGYIPAAQALGTKADVKVRFVHYTMHGEKEDLENYRQLCIREEQNSKYWSYLSCFLEDGNATRCLTKTSVDMKKLTACTANNNTIAKQYYAKDSALSQQYGVQGSPTLIINGAEVNTGRDAASMLKTICSAFNTAPSECTKQLSSDSPSPGFGVATAAAGSASSGAACASA